MIGGDTDHGVDLGTVAYLIAVQFFKLITYLSKVAGFDESFSF